MQSEMNRNQRILLIIVGVLLAGTAAGLVITSDWGSRAVPLGRPQTRATQSPVDMHQMQTAMALAPLAALIPVITAGHWMNEILFCRRWAAHFQEEAKTPRMLWDLNAGTEQV